MGDMTPAAGPPFESPADPITWGSWASVKRSASVDAGSGSGSEVLTPPPEPDPGAATGPPFESPQIDLGTYVALLDHLNAAHRTVTAHLHDGHLPARLSPVLKAIDLAIERTQQARSGADAG